MTKLETLELFSNNITGLLPIGWSALVALKTLRLQDNLLSASLPAEVFSRLTNLEVLDLSGNNIVGGFVCCGMAVAHTVLRSAVLLCGGLTQKKKNTCRKPRS